MDENLPPIREPLDPGIKLAVELLRAKGLATVDSGDGYSKEEALETGDALPYGHVYIQVDKPESVQEVIATASIIFWPYYGYQTPTVELLARPECHTAANEPDIVAVHWPVGGLRRADTGISPFDAAGVQPTQKGGAPAELTPLEVRRLAVRDLLKSVGCRLGYSDPDAEVWWTQKGEVRRIPINGSRMSVSNQMDMLAAVERVLGIQPDVHAPELRDAAESSPQVKGDSSDAGRAPVQPPPGTQPSPVQMAIASVDLQSIKVWRDGWVDADIAFLSEGDIALLPCPWKDTAFQVQSGAYVRWIGGAQQWMMDVVPVPIPEVAPLEPASKVIDHATGPGTDGASDGERDYGTFFKLLDRREAVVKRLLAAGFREEKIVVDFPRFAGGQWSIPIPVDLKHPDASKMLDKAEMLCERREAELRTIDARPTTVAGPIGDAATIADLQEKLGKAIEERDDARAAHSELYAMQERLMQLLCNMGIGHSPMNLYDRVLTLLPRKRVTQWLSMKLAEARLNVEQARFRHPDADDSLDVIKGAIMVEDQALWRLRRHLDGPPPTPSAKVL